ncbi:MAG: hypothetical protein ACI9KN_002328 [Gammaproteobacteria bacterium]
MQDYQSSKNYYRKAQKNNVASARESVTGLENRYLYYSNNAKKTKPIRFESDVSCQSSRFKSN